MAYENPGGAFTNALQDHLFRQAAQDHIMEMDRRRAQHDADTIEIAKGHLNDTRLRTALDQKDKRKAAFEKHVHEDYAPGDFWTPEDIATDKELGTGFYHADVPTAVPPGESSPVPDLAHPSAPPPPMMGGMPAPPSIAPPPPLDPTTNVQPPEENIGGLPPMGMGAPPPASPVGLPDVPPHVPFSTGPAGIPAPPDALLPPLEPTSALRVGAPTAQPKSGYLGTLAQRDKLKKDARIQELRDVLNSTERSDPAYENAATEYQTLIGHNITLKTPKVEKDPKNRYIFDPIKKVYTDTAGTPVSQVPGDAVVDRASEPPVNNAATKEAASVEQSYNKATARIDRRAKPYEDQIQHLDTLNSLLDQPSNPKADAMVIPAYLKATIAGGGVRITGAEIAAEGAGSRSIWDNLQLKINKWSSEPGVDLVLTPEEKRMIRVGAQLMTKRARARIDAINGAREQIDDAGSSDEHHRIVTELNKTLNGDVGVPADTGVGTSVATPAAPSKYKVTVVP